MYEWQVEADGQLKLCESRSWLDAPVPELSREEEIDRALPRLMHTLQALAAPADIQFTLIAGYNYLGPCLVEDFERWADRLRHWQHRFEPEQRAALRALRAWIEELKTIQHPSVWSNRQVRTGDYWERMRSLAAEALVAGGWPVETPPSYAHEYVGSFKEPVD